MLALWELKRRGGSFAAILRSSFVIGETYPVARAAGDGVRP